MFYTNTLINDDTTTLKMKLKHKCRNDSDLPNETLLETLDLFKLHVKESNGSTQILIKVYPSE